MDVLKTIDDTITLLNDLDNYKDSLNENLSIKDQSLSDLYHYIEFNKLDSKASYRMIKELKRILADRRKIKDDMSILRIFEEQKEKMLKKDNRQLMASNIHKQDRMLKKYNYNIYSEEELKELMEA